MVKGVRTVSIGEETYTGDETDFDVETAVNGV
jgi:hypothetical protein